jgi:dihydroorotase
VKEIWRDQGVLPDTVSTDNALRNWEFTDASGARFTGRQAIVPMVTIRAGEVIAPDWGPHPWGWLPAPGPRGRR